MAADSGTYGKYAYEYQKMLDDVCTVLPSLREHVENFTTTLGDVADEFMSYFDEAQANQKHAVATEEAKKLSQELQQTLVYSDAYMAKVDNFAWHARHKDRQKKVMEALQKETPNYGPMKEYLSHLRRSLGRAEQSHTIFEQAGFGGILTRLEKVFADCQKDLSEEERKKLVTQVAGGMLAAGVSIVGAGGGITLAALMAIPTAGIGSMIILGITGATVGAIGTSAGLATAGVTAYKAKQREKLIKGIQALSKLVSKMAGIGRSIQTIITDVRLKLDGVSEMIDNVDSESESEFGSTDSLSASLEQLHERLNEVGDTCAVCRQKLKEKKDILDAAIDKLL